MRNICRAEMRPAAAAPEECAPARAECRRMSYLSAAAGSVHCSAAMEGTLSGRREERFLQDDMIHATSQVAVRCNKTHPLSSCSLFRGCLGEGQIECHTILLDCNNLECISERDAQKAVDNNNYAPPGPRPAPAPAHPRAPRTPRAPHTCDHYPDNGERTSTQCTVQGFLQPDQPFTSMG
ncbi:unnamed protein product [Colias eurytheme]|nr:unnamed protein product [Colias eurytheme]